METALIVSLITLPISLLIASGRGDYLIAGYNTASPAERKQINIKRLRGLVVGLFLFINIIFWIPSLVKNKELYGYIGITIIITTLLVVILANTWAKKK
ncbi:MAG: DUF3784 domain-containing protein [Bacteroides sp.]|nr:DUF3784 domain-containing protein [Bacteroides sp.]